MSNQLFSLTKISPLALLLASGGWVAHANAIVGPFNPGTGSWNVLPQGDFEFGPQAIRSSSNYQLRGDLFLLVAAGSGTASTSPVAAQVGSLGAVIQPGTFTGSGIALSYDGRIPVNPGDQYVLSAFIRRPTPDGSAAHIYIDNGNNPGDHQTFTLPNTSQWQFVWDVYTMPAGGTGITPRVVLDFNVNPNDVVYVDQFAYTPLSQFQPPSVPEPGTLSLLGLTLPVAWGWKRARLNDRKLG